jgi:hypothetical protein
MSVPGVSVPEVGHQAINRWLWSGEDDGSKRKRKRQQNLNTVWGVEAIRVMKDVEARKKYPKTLSKQLLQSIVEIALYTIGGWLFFGARYGWTFIDCYYFAMVTVTTVGYGDLTPDGVFWPDQLAVMVYALIGVAVMTESFAKCARLASAKAKKMAMKAKQKALERSVQIFEEAGAMSESDDEEEDLKPEKEERHETLSQHKARILKEKVVMQVERIAKPTLLLLAQLIACWSIGGAALVLAEGASFTDGFYCAVITSLSIGYGEISPATQEGRLCFAVYIPFSVAFMLGTIAQAFRLVRNWNTVKVIQRSSFEEIFQMDEDGDGTVSKEEYCLFMLEQLGEVDPTVLVSLKKQFDALDADKSGKLERSDFPPTREIKKTLCVYNNEVESVEWEVVKRRDFLAKVTSMSLGGLGVSMYELGKKKGTKRHAPETDSSPGRTWEKPIPIVLQMKAQAEPRTPTQPFEPIRDPAALPPSMPLGALAAVMSDAAKTQVRKVDARSTSPHSSGHTLANSGPSESEPDPLDSLDEINNKRFFV